MVPDPTGHSLMTNAYWTRVRACSYVHGSTASNRQSEFSRPRKRNPHPTFELDLLGWCGPQLMLGVWDKCCFLLQVRAAYQDLAAASRLDNALSA